VLARFGNTVTSAAMLRGSRMTNFKIEMNQTGLELDIAG
jgi:hypothetical protein